ncbi:MAG: STAS domain-containing protein [Phycisphaerae bacterium]|nr:STAS domain-containing protein [Phycisphaerae bacterium]
MVPLDAEPPAPSQTDAPRLDVQDDGQVACVRFPRGQVDGLAVRELYETAIELTDRDHVRMLVDFSGVRLVTSAAMGMLVTIKKKFLQCGGQLHVVIDRPEVRAPFELMNLHIVLNLFEDIAEARRRFK